MSESPQYYIEKKIYHSPGFSFVYEINWNVAAISGNAKATGYIVQHFLRKSTPPNFLVNDTEYYEAWELRNGILLDAGTVCDDRFCVGATTLEDSIRKSLGTKGEYCINGNVYWIPESSSLAPIVNSWSKCVPDAAGLRSNYLFSELTNEYFVFSRPLFIHRWSLITNDEVKSKLKAIFLLCYHDHKDDLEYLSSWLPCFVSSCLRCYLKLAVIQLRIEASLCQKFLVCAAFNDVAVFHH